jgi:2,3-bisphosphoglycerate-dependent phosphoglycerate mutase
VSGPFVPGEPGRPPAGVRTTGVQRHDATTMVLIRHGEANCNVAGVIGGIIGCTGLSPLGQTQVRALAARLAATGELAHASHLYASVLPRAIETAEIIAPAIGGGLDVLTECGLCELHPGDADGLSWPAFSDLYGEPDWDVDPGTPLSPGGESWTGFVDRAAAALEELARRHAGATTVVVCHAGVIEASMLRFLPVAPTRHRLKLRTAHASITQWDRSEDGWQLVRYNDAAHLSGADALSVSPAVASGP